MSRQTTIILLGVLVILIAFSGFPENMRQVLLLLMGAALVVIGLSHSASTATSRDREFTPRSQTFVENGVRHITPEILPSEQE
jgi:sulfite exporter TauE/SafE